jgi:two-component system, NarL family, sensor kinase
LDHNFDSATFYYKKANKISSIINYQKGLFDYASNIGNIYMYQGNYIALIKLMKLSVNNAKNLGDQHYEAKFTANLGNALMCNGQYEEALVYFKKGIYLFKKNKEYQYERKINNYISLCFFNCSNLDMSIKYSKLALLQSEKATDSADICQSLENIGSGYLEKNDFSKAKPFLNRSLLIAQNYKLFQKIANNQYLLSRIYHSEKDSKKAIIFSKKALEYYLETGNNFYTINVFTFLSIYNKDLKQYPESINYLTKAKELAERNKMKNHLVLIYLNMAILNNEIRNYQKAYSYLKKYNELNDSLNSIDLKNKLQKLDLKYEAEKKELQIKSLTQQNKIQNLKSNKRYWVAIALASALLSLGIFAFAQFRNYKTRKALLIAEKQNAIVEERLRIATDMHDDVGSGLSTIRYIVTSVVNGQTIQNVGLQKVIDISDDAIQKMKEIIWSLNESNQNLENLIYYIRGQVGEIVANANIDFEFQIPDTIPSIFFGWKQNRNTYLLVKEAVNNAVKHSGATMITVQFEISNHLFIKISDNGKGFDQTSVSEGNGLKNYKKRIATLNGSYRLNSEIGKGTTVLIDLPL